MCLGISAGFVQNARKYQFPSYRVRISTRSLTRSKTIVFVGACYQTRSDTTTRIRALIYLRKWPCETRFPNNQCPLTTGALSARYEIPNKCTPIRTLSCSACRLPSRDFSMPYYLLYEPQYDIWIDARETPSRVLRLFTLPEPFTPHGSTISAQ